MAMRLVHQAHSNGCVVATTAMLLDLSYVQAFDLYGTLRERIQAEGISDFHMESMLVERGFALAKRHETFQPGNQKRDVWPILPWSDHRYCAVVRHQSGQAHSVALLPDGYVLDPGRPERTSLHDFHSVMSITAVVPIVA